MVSDRKAVTLMETLYLSGNQFSLGSCERTGLFFFSTKLSVITEAEGKTRMTSALSQKKNNIPIDHICLTSSSLCRQTVPSRRWEAKWQTRLYIGKKIEPKCRFCFIYLSKTQPISGMCSAYKLAVCETRWVCSRNSSTSEDVKNLP